MHVRWCDVLDFVERASVAQQFGVTGEQVDRDHCVSHLLAVLAREFAQEVIFFGGTALARTHLPRGRLSEDVDLIATRRRKDVLERLEHILPRSMQREFGRLAWRPPLSRLRETEPAALVTSEGLTVRIQLLSAKGYPPWPTEIGALEQRYSDAPPAKLKVPTLSAFAAWKTATWCDRAAPRDLWDLWAIASTHGISAMAADLFRKHGPTGGYPQPWMFTTPHSAAQWNSQLAGQTILRVSAEDALAFVADAWQRATFGVSA